MYFTKSLPLAAIAVSTAAQVLPQDAAKYGPDLEVVHLYYDQFPTGIAVSREGRLFSNYPPGLEANNTNNGK